MGDFGGTVPLGGTVAFGGTVDFAVRRSELGALMGVLTLGGSSDDCVGSTTNWNGKVIETGYGRQIYRSTVSY